MTFTTRYLGFTCVFRQGIYRVHDQVGNPGIADQYLRFRYLKQCKRYIDELQNCLLNPAPEPEQSHRLLGYYQNNRDDGPLPTVLFPQVHLVYAGHGCRHVEYQAKRGGWCYCCQPLSRQGTTRCYAHEFLPGVQLSELESASRVRMS